MKMKLDIKLTSFALAQFAVVTAILTLGMASYIFTWKTGHDHLMGFLRLWDVGAEQSFPTYFSTLNLLFASILLLVIYGYEKANHHKGSYYWLFMSILFLALSADEAACVHENFVFVHYFLLNKGLIPEVYVTHQWLPFGMVFVVVLGIGLFKFLRSLPRTTLFYFLISGVVFLIGAIGFEYIGAVMIKTGVVDSRHDLLYLIRRVFEEAFEMYGIVLFNCALYREILNRKMSFSISTLTEKA